MSRHADSSTESNTVHDRDNGLVSCGEDVVLLETAERRKRRKRTSGTEENQPRVLSFSFETREGNARWCIPS